MKAILLTFTVLFCLSGFSQTIMPDSYDGVPQSKKSRIFLDNFDDNKYHWIKESSPSSHRIQDGYFFFANDYEFVFIDGKPINFDPNRNFELESKIKFISGKVENYNGIFWNQLLFGDKYFLGFSSMGYYKMDKEVGLQTKNLLEPKKSEIINKTAENSITIRKYGDMYYFFINKNLVHSMPYEELPGQYIGFSVSKKSMVQINFLRLWYIND